MRLRSFHLDIQGVVSFCPDFENRDQLLDLLVWTGAQLLRGARHARCVVLGEECVGKSLIHEWLLGRWLLGRCATRSAGRGDLFVSIADGIELCNRPVTALRWDSY